MKDLLHYQIIAPLGEGAMGQVYRALDTKLGREVAIKMLPEGASRNDADRTSHQRLVREARAAGALNHPGIVTLHDIEDADGREFIVMELVHGERFGELAKRGVPWRRACELVASVAEALSFAHARDILHRDIKSDNLMVTPDGQTKVLDFGLAKLREEAQHATPATISTARCHGTPRCASSLKRSPSTSSITRNVRPSAVSRSCSVTMPGWFSALAARASRNRRACQSALLASSAGSILIATSRPSR